MPQPAHLEIDIRLRRDDFELRVEQVLMLDGVTAIFGPSGAGKTTLLRVIAGLETAASGRVAFGDHEWQAPPNQIRVPAHQRGIGYVFQDGRLFPHLTVAGNLRFAAARTLSDSDGGTGVIAWGEVIDAIDLAPLLERSAQSLSGGERQRVALGRALLSSPRLLALDEPLSALDNRRKRDILPYLERITGTFGVPALYVTHSIDEVVRLASKVVLVEDGRLVAYGPVSDVFERLDLRSLSDAFGAGSLITATVGSHDEEFMLTELVFDGQTLSIPGTDLPTGTEVRLRILARDVALSRVRPEGSTVRNVLAGRIIYLSEQPETAYCETLVDVGGTRLRARITRKSASELELGAGTDVYALIKSVSLDQTKFSGR